MEEIIKRFNNGSFLKYGIGSFDEWCVYFVTAENISKPPKDKEYFTFLKSMARNFDKNKIYSDFVLIYDQTKDFVDEKVLELITNISSFYYDNSLEVDIVFSILYLAMIAEEKKKFTKLGKRIKRLGIYTLLIEDKDVEYSANFMKGKKWQEIDCLCKLRGF